VEGQYNPFKLRPDLYTQKERLFTGILTQITGCTLMRIAAIFFFVLIICNEILWIPYDLLKGKRSVFTNIESASCAEYRDNTDRLKK
jgi:hypothetical protein